MESLRVDGNEECEDADPPLVFFKTLSEDDVVCVRGHGICLVSLAAGSPAPAAARMCTSLLMRSMFEGEPGWAPLPCTSWFTACHGTKIDECLDWKVISGESEVEQWQESPALTSGGWEPETGKCFLG